MVSAYTAPRISGFSAPAVDLGVWKPREGPQQGCVKEWIQLIRRREPTAKILMVATHGGPQDRQPDIDLQELWDLYNSHCVPRLILDTCARSETHVHVQS